MNEQIQNIYMDVLVMGYEIMLKKQIGNKYHIITYYPYPPMMDLIKKGYPLEVALEQTSYHDYILENDDEGPDAGWEVKNNLIFSK